MTADNPLSASVQSDKPVLHSHVAGDLDALEITPELRERLKASGITSLFDVQARCVPLALTGVPLAVRSATGSGKTLAFCLPLVESLLRYKKKHPAKCTGRGRPPRALILSPTRELARQTASVVDSLLSSGLTSLLVYGGVPIDPQLSSLRSGVDVVIATPGRAIDLQERGALDLTHLRVAVLDEADEMMRVGFCEDVEKLLEGGGKKRQLLLFSATMPDWAHSIAKRFSVGEPTVLDLTSKQLKKTARGCEHLSIACPREGRAGIIEDIVRKYAGVRGRTILFCQTKKEANELAMAEGFGSGSQVLHGDIPQAQREVTLAAFRAGRFSCLVATDVAARGIDIPEVQVSSSVSM